MIEFEGKLPDPDESWNDFFKRICNFELHNPPLVNEENVPSHKRTSIFMKLQTKLLECIGAKCKIV
jgi:hypothetical protein